MSEKVFPSHPEPPEPPEPPDVRVRLSEDEVRNVALEAGFRVERVSVNAPEAVHTRITGFINQEYDHPLLQLLCKEYKLQEVVSSGKTEWEQQRLLKHWVHTQIPRGWAMKHAVDALSILGYARRGITFYCTHYAITYWQCALALGWEARTLGIDRDHGLEGYGSWHHGVSEVWSNEFCKWILIDAMFDVHFELDGIPLNAWEIRREWLRNQGKDLLKVLGAPPNEIRKKGKFSESFPDADESANFFWIQIGTSNPGFDRPEGRDRRAILILDNNHLGKTWYQNDYEFKRAVPHQKYAKNLFIPTTRLSDAYWTIGVVEVCLSSVPKQGAICLDFKSVCPGLAGYEVSVDEEQTEVMKANRFLWKVHDGVNSLQVRTVKESGVKGPATKVEIEGKMQT